jgi:hypothetical protein
MAISNKLMGKIVELHQGNSTPLLRKYAQQLMALPLFEMCQGSTVLDNNTLNGIVAELKSIGTPNALSLRDALLS